MNVLEIKDLYKEFGNNKVINGLNLFVPENSVFGFLGQNGSGKTTTMKMVLGLLKPTSGSITVGGELVQYGETKTNRYIGYLPDVPEFYGYMKPMEYLKLCGDITGLSKAQTRGKSEELLGLVGLLGVNKRISSFSRGMKQRLGIAQALLNDPKLLICDEPTSALDPIGRREILDILHAVKGKTTVIFSTHILSDVERICDYVGVLNKGSLSLAGTLSEIKERSIINSYKIEFSSETDAMEFSTCSEIASFEVEVSEDKCTLIIKVDNIQSGGRILMDLLSQKQIIPYKFEVLEPSLENLFMEVVK